MDAARVGRGFAIAVLAYLTAAYARAPFDASPSRSWLHLPDLVFHEAGHILFMPFGEFMSVLGGSLFQLLVPLACAASFAWQQRNWFGSAVCVWWVGQNLSDLAPYIADARRLQLPLIGGHTGAEVEGHDWEYLLSAAGALHWDLALGRLVHHLGTLVMMAALLWAAALVLRRKEQDTAG